MADVASDLSARTLANDAVLGAPAAVPDGSAHRVWQRLLRLELRTSSIAVLVIFVLALFGLDFSTHQWLLALTVTPLCVAAYMLPDMILLRRHFRPIGAALARLDRGEKPTRAEASEAIVRALNLPFFCFVRVSLLHGPFATASILTAFVILNHAFNAGFALWQMLIFSGTAMLFAAPTHAIFEYFGVARDMAKPIHWLTPYVEEGILPEHHPRLVAVPLRSKLLYLSIVIAGLPLVFFSASIIFKINNMLWLSSTVLTLDQMLPLWTWIGGMVFVCLLLGLATSVFTAAEVSRSAATLVHAMRNVESGTLDTDLSIVSTDEYAELFRGFNHMVRGLRDEAKLIEITQGLAGELNLDTLFQRIMSAAAELMDAERASLFVCDKRSGQLWSRFATGLHSGEIRIPSNAGIAGTVFTTGIAENIPDVYADPRFDRAVDHDTGYRTRNILCLPIVNKAGERIGVTEVLNKRGNRQFTPKDESQLRAFTAQVAVLLENAQLFEEVLSVKTYNENILRSTSNGIITTDLAGRIVTANDAALAILRMEGQAVIGSLAAKVFTGKNSWVNDSMARVNETGTRDSSPDAKLRLAHGTASVNMAAEPLFGPDSTQIGTMLVFEDITDEARVKATMRRYMSKEIADQLLASGEAALGGKMQTVTILFSDVRNFTGLSEMLGARETVSMLNEYFSEMVAVVSQHGGILDKYIGDAIMALFGVPFENPDDADHAVAVANGMMLALRGLNQKRQARGEQLINIGVGMATGDVIVGNIGSPSRMEYTVIGDSVNLASRLEGANKFYGTRILFDVRTKESLKNPGLLREIDLVQVKGKDTPVPVYESLIYAAELPGVLTMVECFEQGLAAYRGRDWQGAIGCFEAALAACAADDAPSRMYIDRCRQYLSAPPPEGWNGVWVLTEK